MIAILCVVTVGVVTCEVVSSIIVVGVVDGIACAVVLVLLWLFLSGWCCCSCLH